MVHEVYTALAEEDHSIQMLWNKIPELQDE